MIIGFKCMNETSSLILKRYQTLEESSSRMPMFQQAFSWMTRWVTAMFQCTTATARSSCQTKHATQVIHWIYSGRWVSSLVKPWPASHRDTSNTPFTLSRTGTILTQNHKFTQPWKPFLPKHPSRWARCRNNCRDAALLSSGRRMLIWSPGITSTPRWITVCHGLRNTMHHIDFKWALCGGVVSTFSVLSSWFLCCSAISSPSEIPIMNEHFA